jgi:hypothetical protein
MKSITIYAAGLLWLLSSGQTYAYESSGRAMKSQHFTENKGQVRDQYLVPRTDIDFKLSAGNGLNVFMGKGHISYQWAKPQAITTDAESGLEHTTYELYRMDVVLLGVNNQASVQAEERQPGYERYFQPWVNTLNSNNGVIAQHYRRVTYRNVYPHIDWVFYFNDNGQLEHDFVVRPGGKVSDIKMQYRGAGKVALTANGSLSATTDMGTITEQAPIAHEATGRRVPVRFIAKENVIQFEVGNYEGTLTIDPVVEWASYFGGALDDSGTKVESDKWGNLYICGLTKSANNIATTGAHQTTYATGTSDAYLAKWSSGGAMLWATYYGGEAEDVANGLGCDTLGNVYLGGYTKSTDGIATVGSAQSAKGGNPIQERSDAFLVKFDSSGIRQWGTYFGGSNQDAQVSFALTTDNENNVYITGNALSTDLPTTPGTHQLVKAGSTTTNDAFICKYNSDGTRIWTTYFGGTSHEYPLAITTDSAGDLYVVGYTLSTAGIATTNAHQPALSGGEDGFITKFNNAGTQLWGTYFGGTGSDRLIAVSATSTKLVFGGTSTSTNIATTINTHQPNLASAGLQDGILGCMDLNGSLQWCTYYGGEHTDIISGLHVKNDGAIYVSGRSNSSTGIATPNSLQDTISGSYDCFLAKFNDLGERAWATYFGGYDGEQNSKIAGRDNLIYMTGYTMSPTGIATSNGQQQSINGGADAFLAVFNDCYIPTLNAGVEGEAEVCGYTAQTYSIQPDTGASYYVWILPSGWSGSSSGPSITVSTGNTSGLIQVVAVSDCGSASDTQAIYVEVLPAPEPVIVESNYILSTTQSYASYQWQLNSTDLPSATQATHIATENGLYGLRVTASNGCTGTADEITVSGIVSIEEQNKNQHVNIFPNPTSAELFVELPATSKVSVYTIDGKRIINDRTLLQGINKLNTANLSSGIYLLTITSNSLTTSHKFEIK